MSVWPFVHTVLNLFSSYEVDKSIQNPYMDEYFHVGQTMTYLITNDFTKWDPKITTPPGLYVLGYLAGQIVSPSLPMLRALNWLATLIVYATPLPVPSFIVHAFPLFFFYTNLYYTDPMSTALVLSGLALVYKNKPNSSALVFLLSLMFRQTNVIWAGYAAATYIAQETTIVQAFKTIPNYFRRAMKLKAFLLLMALFLLFVKVNGSIVLGDKSHHTFSYHFAQLLYFLFFLTFFSFPLAIDFKQRRLSFPLKIKWLPLELAVIWGIIRYGTCVHPFLLADNRHYTFYIWRRLCTPLNGNLLIPVYWISYKWFASALDFSQVRCWAFLGAVCAVLVPSPLMEPRYYIVPYLIWRIYFLKRKSSFMENVWYALVNLVTVLIMCKSATHFMW